MVKTVLGPTSFAASRKQANKCESAKSHGNIYPGHWAVTFLPSFISAKHGSTPSRDEVNVGRSRRQRRATAPYTKKLSRNGGYYLRFIPHFANKAEPLTALMKKGSPMREFHGLSVSKTHLQPCRGSSVTPSC